MPNDVSLGVDGVDGVLLYGVNSVGKSSIMKAVGLAVVAAQAGMFVAADALELGERPFTGIYTRIGLRDDLARGHSTFVVEMLELRAILRRASARSLVIGDELCAGTEAQSALAIVGAGVVTLAKRGARFAFATHLHELPRLPQVTFSLADGVAKAQAPFGGACPSRPVGKQKLNQKCGGGARARMAVHGGSWQVHGRFMEAYGGSWRFMAGSWQVHGGFMEAHGGSWG